jgi:hypothetical protein
VITKNSESKIPVLDRQAEVEMESLVLDVLYSAFLGLGIALLLSHHIHTAENSELVPFVPNRPCRYWISRRLATVPSQDLAMYVQIREKV